VPKSNPSTIKLQVFKGREAKLNKATFTILAHQGPQTIYEIHNEAKAQRGLKNTRYASVNKRTRFLEETGYIKDTGVKKTKAGFQASIYEFTAKAYLAIAFSFVNSDNLLMRVDDASAQTILLAFLYVL
jgi:hypothetical protein